MTLTLNRPAKRFTPAPDAQEAFRQSVLSGTTDFAILDAVRVLPNEWDRLRDRYLERVRHRAMLDTGIAALQEEATDAHVVRFANQLGTPNWYEPGLANCYIPRITVSNLTYGGFVTPDYYGDVPPERILATPGQRRPGGPSRAWAVAQGPRRPGAGPSPRRSAARGA